MQRIPVESKSMRSVGYDPEAHELEIEFRTGRVYAFREVPESVHSWLMRSPNKGGIFTRLIRDRYPFHEVTAAKEPADLSDALRKSIDPNKDD